MKDTPLLVDVFPIRRPLLVGTSHWIHRYVHKRGGKRFIFPRNKVSRSTLWSSCFTACVGCFCRDHSRGWMVEDWLCLLLLRLLGITHRWWDFAKIMTWWRSLSDVGATRVVEGGYCDRKKKGKVHQVRAPKYYVQNHASIKYEMPVEPTQKNYQWRCAFIWSTV